MSLQALSVMRTSTDVSNSYAIMVVYVRATVAVSDAFVRNKAKMGAYMGERTARLHLQAVMITNVRIEEYALPYLLMTSTLIHASALLASPALNARPPPSSHLSPEATST